MASRGNFEQKMFPERIAKLKRKANDIKIKKNLVEKI